MSKRYDAVTPRPKQDGGTWWHKVGSGYEGEDGKIKVYLDSAPFPDDKGKVMILLGESKPKQDHQGERERVPERKISTSRDDMNDEIPFN